MEDMDAHLKRFEEAHNDTAQHFNSQSSLAKAFRSESVALKEELERYRGDARALPPPVHQEVVHQSLSPRAHAGDGQEWRHIEDVYDGLRAFAAPIIPNAVPQPAAAQASSRNDLAKVRPLPPSPFSGGT